MLSDFELLEACGLLVSGALEVAFIQDVSFPGVTKNEGDMTDINPVWFVSIATRLYAPAGTSTCDHVTKHVRASTADDRVRSTNGIWPPLASANCTVRSLVMLIVTGIDAVELNSHVKDVGVHVVTFPGGVNCRAPEGMAVEEEAVLVLVVAVEEVEGAFDEAAIEVVEEEINVEVEVTLDEDDADGGGVDDALDFSSSSPLLVSPCFACTTKASASILSTSWIGSLIRIG